MKEMKRKEIQCRVSASAALHWHIHNNNYNNNFFFRWFSFCLSKLFETCSATARSETSILIEFSFFVVEKIIYHEIIVYIVCCICSTRKAWEFDGDVNFVQGDGWLNKFDQFSIETVHHCMFNGHLHGTINGKHHKILEFECSNRFDVFGDDCILALGAIFNWCY